MQSHDDDVDSESTAAGHLTKLELAVCKVMGVSTQAFLQQKRAGSLEGKPLTFKMR